MEPTVVGVDIAKRVFRLHWIVADTGEMFDRQLRRTGFLKHFANRERCFIGIEACGGAQHWVRRLLELGHEVTLMPGKLVKAFVTRNKNDVADARAIWAAIAEIPGVGFLTVTAAVASMGDSNAFRSGREFAARVGLVPDQFGTCGKVRLLGISKRGDRYLRTLMIHGARSVMKHAKDPGSWVVQSCMRVVVVAMANKIARTIWVLLAHGRSYSAS